MTRSEAETELERLGFHGLGLQRLLDAARAQTEVMSSGDPAGRVRVTYSAGVYTVTR